MDTSGSRMRKSKTPGSWEQREHKADRDRRKLIHEAWPHCASGGVTLLADGNEPQITQMPADEEEKEEN